MDIDYSVIIRTTGKAGEKYQKLLNSIDALNPKPREVIVVLPEGYDPPMERLGWEHFHFCPKGMVIQRMTGIHLCQSPYALICDDDVSFEANFVQKLHEPIEKGLAKLSAGPLYSFLPQFGIKAIVDVVSGAAFPTIFHKDRYCSVLRTTGYSYSRQLRVVENKFYETQSLPWTCFYAEVSELKRIDFDAEQRWLDKNGYSAMDDQAMFYKAWLRGIRTVVVADAVYVHQDARTSTKNNKPVVLRSMVFNRIVFWHRFIFNMETNGIARTWARICFAYRMFWIRLRAWIDFFRGRYSKEDIQTVFQACSDGWKYVNSEEYLALPEVRKV